MPQPTPLERYEQRVDVPLLVTSVAWLLLYSWPVIDPSLDPAIGRAMHWGNVAIWLVFCADYLTRMRLSGHPWRFVRHHLLLLAAIILPVLRPLHVVRVLAYVSLIHRSAGAALRGRVMLYTGVCAVLVWYVGAVSVLQAERGAPGANLESAGDALWWSLTTMTTVGYGDYYPVTLAGRLAAAVVMVAGVALMGAVTATFASWLVEQARPAPPVTDEDVAHRPRPGRSGSVPDDLVEG